MGAAEKPVVFKVKKILVENLQKKRKNFAIIDEITFQVHEGEIFVLAGIDGSGKTLLTKTIEKIALPDNGTVDFDRKNTGMVICDQHFYSEKTIYKTAKHYATLNKKRISKERIVNILNMLGLKQMKNFTIERLNKKQLARLRIAVALITRPGILILDEPFKDLSAEESRIIRVILKTLADCFNTAILLTAPDLSGVEEICDTVSIIDNGMIVYTKSYNEMTRENEPYTKLCVSTPAPNLAAMTVEKSLGYETNICGPDVIVNTHPDNAKSIYDELVRSGITVFGMTKVNKSVQEQFFKLINQRRGFQDVLD
jgi:ABC-2 type transport system ATP-binding protein